jgi:hypothetical protein
MMLGALDALDALDALAVFAFGRRSHAFGIADPRACLRQRGVILFSKRRETRSCCFTAPDTINRENGMLRNQ